MKTDVIRKILTLSIILLLASCATSNTRIEEGGIGGTGNADQCDGSKEVNCNKK